MNNHLSTIGQLIVVSGTFTPAQVVSELQAFADLRQARTRPRPSGVERLRPGKRRPRGPGCAAGHRTTRPVPSFVPSFFARAPQP